MALLDPGLPSDKQAFGLYLIGQCGPIGRQRRDQLRRCRDSMEAVVQIFLSLDPSAASPVVFSPDGSRLATIAACALWMLCMADEHPPEAVVASLTRPQVIAHAAALLASDNSDLETRSQLLGFLSHLAKNHRRAAQEVFANQRLFDVLRHCLLATATTTELSDLMLRQTRGLHAILPRGLDKWPEEFTDTVHLRGLMTYFLDQDSEQCWKVASNLLSLLGLVALSNADLAQYRKLLSPELAGIAARLTHRFLTCSQDGCAVELSVYRTRVLLQPPRPKAFLLWFRQFQSFFLEPVAGTEQSQGGATTGLDLLLQGLETQVAAVVAVAGGERPARVLDQLVTLLFGLVDGNDEVREAVVSNERAMFTLSSAQFKAAAGARAEELLLLLSLRGQGQRSHHYGKLSV